MYQSSKTVKNSQTAKMTIGVPIVTYLHRVRQIHKVRVRVRRPRPRPPNTQSLTNRYVFVSLSQLSTDTVKILIAHVHVGLTIYDNRNSLHNLNVGLSSYRDIQHFVISTKRTRNEIHTLSQLTASGRNSYLFIIVVVVVIIVNSLWSIYNDSSINYFVFDKLMWV